MFELLDYYDLALAHGTNDRSVVRIRGARIQGITPYNCGVILFRRTEAVRELFELWRSCYESQVDQLPHDQPAFLEAYSLTNCRTYVLQNNWNARFIYPEKYAGEVVLLHGRHRDLDYIGRKINRTRRPRLWWPEAEMCIFRGMSGLDMVALGLRMIRVIYRRLRHEVGNRVRSLARLGG